MKNINIFLLKYTKKCDFYHAKYCEFPPRVMKE